MLIGEFANKSGLSRETIRFYEKQGLLEKNQQKMNNYRVYSEKELEKIKIIHNLKHLGFALSKIKDLLHLYESDLKCKHTVTNFEIHLKEVEKKITFLKNIQINLKSAIQICNANSNKNTCSVLEGLRM